MAVTTDDRAVIERIRSGDPAAFEELFRSHYPSLLRFARSQLPGGSTAEDVVQDVFLKVWRERLRLRVERSARAYLLAAVRNRVIDLRRRESLERRWLVRDADAALGDADEQSAPEHAAPGPTSNPAELAELEDAVRRGIADLPERCRTAFLLCREEQLTYAEAADAMGVAPATVKTQVARALSSLREAVAPFLPVLLSATVLLV